MVQTLVSQRHDLNEASCCEPRPCGSSFPCKPSNYHFRGRENPTNSNMNLTRAGQLRRAWQEMTVIALTTAQDRLKTLPKQPRELPRLTSRLSHEQARSFRVRSRGRPHSLHPKRTVGITFQVKPPARRGSSRAFTRLARSESLAPQSPTHCFVDPFLPAVRILAPVSAGNNLNRRTLRSRSGSRDLLRAVVAPMMTLPPPHPREIQHAPHSPAPPLPLLCRLGDRFVVISYDDLVRHGRRSRSPAERRVVSDRRSRLERSFLHGEQTL